MPGICPGKSPAAPDLSSTAPSNGFWLRAATGTSFFTIRGPLYMCAPRARRFAPPESSCYIELTSAFTPTSTRPAPFGPRLRFWRTTAASRLMALRPRSLGPHHQFCCGSGSSGWFVGASTRSRGVPFRARSRLNLNPTRPFASVVRCTSTSLTGISPEPPFSAL